MLSDVDVNDVVVRVLAHMFPGARWTVRLEDEGAPTSDAFRLSYDGPYPEPRALYGIDIDHCGPIDSPEARELIAGVPELLGQMADEGHAVEGFGTVGSIQGTGTEHLDFDDRLVASFAVRSARCAPDSLSPLGDLFRFLRFASEHRYEAVSPEISLAVGASAEGAATESLGHLSLDLLAKNKAALILGRNGALVYHTGPQGRIHDIEPLEPLEPGGDTLDVPTRLAPLARLSREQRCVCIHLDQTPSLYVLVDGVCRFRYLNGHWTWLAKRPPSTSVAREDVSRQAMRLGCDLADQGAGAILTFVDAERDGERVLERVHPDCVPVLAKDDSPVGVRGRFNRWLSSHELTLQNAPIELLRNLCRVDGATFIDGTSGRILGYGAIVEAASDPQQGARSTAARSLAETFGAAIKVSEDRTATLFERGHGARRIW